MLMISAGLVSGNKVSVPVFMPDTAVSDMLGLVRPAYLTIYVTSLNIILTNLI
jgi:hypothetical protein